MSLPCSSSLGSLTYNHCCCCPFALQPLILPPLKPPRRTGIKRLFCDSDDDDDRTPLRLPSISSICNLQTRYTSLADDSRTNTGHLFAPASAVPRSNTTLVEAFVAEFRRRPSPSAVAFWAQMRPRVVSINLTVPFSRLTSGLAVRPLHP